MPDRPQSTPPPWEESDSFRETMLQLLDDPADREAVRHAGRVLYDLAVETTREVGTTPADPSITRAGVTTRVWSIADLVGLLPAVEHVGGRPRKTN
jgi:hypothetical protein